MLNIKPTIFYDKISDTYTVDDVSKPGSPPVGRSQSMIEAIGYYFHNNQRNLGIEFIVDETCVEQEQKRRETELSKR